MKRKPFLGSVRMSFWSSPLSPTAARAALMRFARAESETIRPCQTALQKIVLADDASAVADQVDQQVEHLRLDRDEGAGAA